MDTEGRHPNGKSFGSIRRVGVLACLAVALGTASAAASNHEDDPPAPWTIPAEKRFAYGVASGEVRETSAVLWARAGRAGTAILRVASDPGFTRVVETQRIHSLARDDFTVQAVVDGLRPGRSYYFRFSMRGDRSETGRFNTPPSPRADAPVSFSFSGDAQATPDPFTGRPFFNDFQVFDRMTEEGNDFNVLQGDTIYSDTQVGGDVDGVELVSPWTATSAPQKWSVYRQNLALEPMARFRGASTLYSHWDDHEFVNNFTKDDDGRALFRAGKRAFLDYTPLRGYSGKTGLYRTVRWGRNLQLFFLDQSSFRTRMAESKCRNPATGKPDPAPTLPTGVRALYRTLVPALEWEVSDVCLNEIARSKGRTMLGAAQFKRFIDDLDRSTATFKVVMLQEPIQHLIVNQYDRWESYAAERKRLLQSIRRVSPENLIFLTTDMHANFIGEVRMQTYGRGGPIPTPYTEVVTGPIAATTHKGQLNGAVDNPNAGNLVRNNLYTAPVDPKGELGGLGLICANIDVYSYGQVEVTSEKLIVTLKDLNGNPVLSEGSRQVPAGQPCPAVELRAR